ncbi:MAG: hypothetical protein P1Q69_19405 [Candidatus Thorarchaeota archaeon]|nr:hypothetical protein [Candidatus Thorarchaeota archaeon]
MSLKDEFPELSSSLLREDGLNSIFYLIKAVRGRTQSSLNETVLKALATVKKLDDEGVEPSDVEMFNALYPVIEMTLVYGKQAEQIHALWALAILTKRGTPVGPLPSMTSLLTSKNEDIVRHAVWVVQMYSHKELDISDTITLLETLLIHSDYRTRNMAADALSEHKISIGDEERLLVIETLFYSEGLDDYWTVSVHHRRFHALNDKPITRDEYTVHFTAQRMCGNCGFKKADCIFYWDDSGTGWRDRTSEYVCPECGKYTVYCYFD